MVQYLPFMIITVSFHQCAVIDVDIVQKSVGTEVLRGIGKMDVYNCVLMLCVLL